YDVPISENSLVCDNHSDIFSDFKINDDISIYDDDFENIEYVEASLSDPKIVSVEEENVVQQEEEVSDNSLLENFSPEFETFCDHSEETGSGNTTHANYSLPEYDSFCFEIEPGQERLINLMKNDISDSSNDPLLEEVDLFFSIIRYHRDNLSISRPPLEPPYTKTDAGEEILVVMNEKDEDVDYSSFIFVIFAKMLSLFSAENEDTIFDPGISD
nr:hypothetical protein [Tanacetum cinerariifolium]